MTVTPSDIAEAIARAERAEEERDRFEAALARACLVGGTTYLVERAEAAEAEVARFKEALRDLYKAAGEVSRWGATTGPQWSKLTVALLKSKKFV